MAQQCTSMEGMEGLKASPNLTRQFCLFGMGGMRRPTPKPVALGVSLMLLQKQQGKMKQARLGSHLQIF